MILHAAYHLDFLNFLHAYLLFFFKTINFKEKIQQYDCLDCQTAWIQIRLDFVGPDLGPNCLQAFCLQSSL